MPRPLNNLTLHCLLVYLSMFRLFVAYLNRRIGRHRTDHAAASNSPQRRPHAGEGFPDGRASRGQDHVSCRAQCTAAARCSARVCCACQVLRGRGATRPPLLLRPPGALHRLACTPRTATRGLAGALKAVHVVAACSIYGSDTRMIFTAPCLHNVWHNNTHIHWERAFVSLGNPGTTRFSMGYCTR